MCIVDADDKILNVIPPVGTLWYMSTISFFTILNDSSTVVALAYSFVVHLYLFVISFSLTVGSGHFPS